MSEKTNGGSKKLIIGLAVAVILVIVAANSFFTLEENQSALVQRFGNIRNIYVREASDALYAQLKEDGESVGVIVGTGLKFKVPFIDNVIKYPATLNLYETPPREVITEDKRKLYFDNSAQWRIENPLRFYKAYNDMSRAEKRIDDVLYSSMNIRVGRIQSHVLITDREESGDMLLELAEDVSRDLVKQGIVVLDVRIKRTDLPAETYESIYNRMKTEREQMAAKHRSEGEEIFLEIRSETDREVITITSRALREAEEIRGAGDSEAARVYNEAYSADPDFFEFYNILETYKLTVGDSATLVIPLDSPFAKYLLGAMPGGAAAASVPPQGLTE